MGNLTSQFKELWTPLGANQKLSLGLAAGLVVIAMAMMMVWASRPDMQLLYGNLPPEEAGKIISTLEQKGIAFETGKGGNAIYVESSVVHRLRMELATEGIPAGSGPGFELFNEGSFGISDFVQRTNFLRAIQGELSRTITQFDGVRSARVMVVMPENRIVVSREGKDRPTASVFVDTAGGMPLSGVNSIRHLVANAIQGLDVNDVVVVDSSGLVLSEELTSSGLAGGMSNDVIRYRKSLETYFTAKVQTMLDRVLGSGNSEVRVAADVDTSSLQTTETTFDPESQVARSVSTSESKNSESENGNVPGGVAGVTNNIPNANGGQNAGGSARLSNDSNKTREEDFAINEVVSNRVQSPGTIRRLTASLLVAMRYAGDGASRAANPRTPEEMLKLQEIVVNALGIELGGGQALDDFVTITEMDFAEDPFGTQAQLAEQGVDINYWVDMAKGLGGLVLGIGVIIFFLKMLKKNQPEQISIEVLQPEKVLQGRKLEDTSVVTPEMLNELIRQKPANIGVSLREWIGDAETARR